MGEGREKPRQRANSKPEARATAEHQVETGAPVQPSPRSPLVRRFRVRRRVFIAARALLDSAICSVWVSQARLLSRVLAIRVGKGHRVL